MQVIKRDGRPEPVQFDKITVRLQNLAHNIEPPATAADVSRIAQHVVAAIHDNIKTSTLDLLTADIAASHATDHPDYGILAGRILVSNLHKTSADDVRVTYANLEGVVSREIIDLVGTYGDQFNAWIDYSRDFMYDYFGFRTLERSYLLKRRGTSEVVERPQHMCLRVALGIWGDNLERVRETYEYLSLHKFTHASPTLFNAGTPTPQLASCFVADTAVTTVNRGPVPIQNVAIGDLVVTHRGNVKPVTQLHVNPLGDRAIYHVEVSGNPAPIRVTGNHRLWTVRGDSVFPHWVAVEDLVPDKDYVGVPRKRDPAPQEFHHIDVAKLVEPAVVYGDRIAKTWTVTTDLAWLFGAWIAAGSITQAPSTIRFEIEDAHMRDAVASIGKDVFGLDPVVGSNDVVWNTMFGALAFKQLFLATGGEKRVPAFAFGWPVDLARAFLDGIADCAGNDPSRPKILDDLFHLRRLHAMVVYGSDAKEMDGTVERFVRVTRVERAVGETPDFVYTLGVEDDHSYSVEGVLAENCFLLGVHIDSLDNIFDTFHKIATISKYGGGIGMHIHGIRAKGSLISSTNGVSDGIVPMLKVANEVVRYVNQCFVPETLVYTRDSGVQRMDCVKIGDHLVTRDGTFKRVNEVFVRSVVDEPMVTLTPKFKTSGITCTRVHEIFALRGQTLGFHPAAELEVGDLLGFPIPRDVVDYPFDKDFCRVYGRALAGGVKTFRTFVETNEEFGTDDPAPFFDPRFLNLPRPKTLALVHGLLETSAIGPDDISFDAPINLVPSVRYLCLRLGILTQESDGVLKIPKHPVLAKETGWFAPSNIPYFEHEGILYTRLASVGTSKYTGDVYDFNMESNHNYTTDCGLVHNSGKRKGSLAVYLEPHHADIMEFLDLRRNQGDEHLRARDLFYAMWTSDLFMERVETNAQWSLFDPGTAPGLDDVWGDAYRALYEKYEIEGRAVRTLPAHDVWFSILRAQVETGMPYMVFKDACNAKSNQQNLGTIKCSNLCSEIVQFTAQDETAVCNLGSLALPKFVVNGAFEYEGLHAATKVLTRNLDRVIDRTFYPIVEAENSNMRHRPIGLGVQGLADVFFVLKIPFDSPEAADINTKIFATIYHAAVETSCDMASELGRYSSFAGSPASEGKLQFDLWGAAPHPMYDWDALKRRVVRVGLRNSLLVAPMPTATTAQILGNCECFEPITSNLYSRTTLAGTFTLVNKYLLADLLERGLWTPELKNKLIQAEGSVQGLAIPDDMKKVYKTAYELSMKTVIDMAADRGIYVDQSMSLNMFVAEPTFRKLSSMLFYAWRRGLKTGMYYCRSRAASSAVKITTGPEACEACSA